MAAGKNFSGWVPGSHVDAVEKIVADRYDGNASAFIADVVVHAVERERKEALVELAREYHPTLLDEITDVVRTAQLNQPRAVVRLLDAANDALRAGVDLTKPVAIFNSEAQMHALLAREPFGPLLLERLRDVLDSVEEPPPAAGAEEQAPLTIVRRPSEEEIRAQEQRRKKEQEAKPDDGATHPKSGRGRRR